MLATLQVAAVASLLRYFERPTQTSEWPLLWVAISLLSLISWPISRGIFTGTQRRSDEDERKCPVCRRVELRPLVKPGAGIFQDVSSFRCRACWTTIRLVEGSLLLEPFRSAERQPVPEGIRFLDEPEAEGEIRFLDDRPKSLD
jgi:hypothetical protein